MAATKQNIINMLDILPPNEQEFAFEVIRKLVIAWDPDYTKLTPKEADDLKTAHEQFNNGEYITDDGTDLD